MAHLPPSIHEAIRRQHGIVSATQLLDAGLTRSQIDRLRMNGVIEPYLRGAFRNPGTPESELMRCSAVTLAHPRVAVAGVTAGRLWGLRRLPRDLRVHVVAPRNWRATTQPWCRAYRTDAIRAADVVEHRGIRVTSRARTVLDLTRSISDDDIVRSIMEQAAADGGLTDLDLAECATDWTPGRPWVARYLRLVGDRLGGGAADSEAEMRVGVALRRAGVRGLVRQHAVDLPGFGAIRFDLALPSERWAVEVDLHPSHRDAVGRKRDARRDAAARHAGWRVRRVSERDYVDAFEATITQLVADQLGDRTA